jgi:hypothetical protein
MARLALTLLAALVLAVATAPALAADPAAVGQPYAAYLDRVASMGRDTVPAPAVVAAFQQAVAAFDAQGHGFGRDSNFAGVPAPEALLAPQAGGQL